MERRSTALNKARLNLKSSKQDGNNAFGYQNNSAKRSISRASAAGFDVFGNRSLSEHFNLQNLLQDAESNDDLIGAGVAEYSSIYKSLESEWHNRKIPLKEVVLEPPEDASGVEEEFQDWYSHFSKQVTDLDRHLPRIHFGAESLKQEVSDIMLKWDENDTVSGWIFTEIAKRKTRLNTCWHLVNWRLQSMPRTMMLSGSVKAKFESSLKVLEQEVNAIDARLAELEEAAEFQEILDSPEWASIAMVLSRQMIFEEVVTRGLRRFQQRIQYLNLTHRSRLWRRSLEFGAIVDITKETRGSPAPPLPLGLLDRRRLENAALAELAGPFSCAVSLTSDRGKAFAHVVSVTFPEVFEKQQKRILFRVLPVSGFGPLHGKTSASPCGSEQTGSVRKSGVPNWMCSSDGVGMNVDKQADTNVEGSDVPEHHVYFLRPSNWTSKCPWAASVDPTVEEQNCLLRESHSSSVAPTRTTRRENSYAHELLSNVLTSWHQSASPDAKYVPDVDSLLHAEWSFLQVSNANVAARRIHEVVDRRLKLQDNEREHDVPSNAMPHHLQRGYLMLRLLQCRSHRWRLLAMCNFYRYLQRRLTMNFSSDGASPNSQEERSASNNSLGGGAVERGGERYWELSPRTLRNIGKACRLPFSSKVADEDLETLTLLGDEENVGEILSADDPGRVAVVDFSGRKIIHAIALEDLAKLERDLLSIGSYYIHKYESRGAADGTEKRERVDRNGVLVDLYAAEVKFNTEKTRLLEVYFEIYQLTCDNADRNALAQRIIDVAAARPKLDLEDVYFTDAYAASICALGSRRALLGKIITRQIHIQRTTGSLVSASVSRSEAFASQMHSDRPDTDVKDIRSAVKSRRTEAARTTDMDFACGLTGSDDAPRSPEFKEPRTTAFAIGPRPNDETDIRLPILTHACEGYGYGVPEVTTVQGVVNLTLHGNPVSPGEFCISANLVWKTELLLEEVHRNLVEHFHPPSTLIVVFLERACYAFATELWKEVCEEEDRRRGSTKSSPEKFEPHDDAELVAAIVRETATVLTSNSKLGRASVAASASSRGTPTEEPLLSPTGAEKRGQSMSTPLPGSNENQSQKPPRTPDKGNPLIKEMGGLDTSGFLVYGFADIRRQVGVNACAMFGSMYANALEHLLWRRKVQDVVSEVACLEKALKAQALIFGHKVESIRPVPQQNGEQPEARIPNSVGNMSVPPAAIKNEWAEPSAPNLVAGMIEAAFSGIKLDNPRNIALNSCSPVRVKELRVLLQVEVAYRSHLLTCVHINALMLDAQTRQKEFSEVTMVGPSRDMVLADPFVKVIKKLRETVELSASSVPSETFVPQRHGKYDPVSSHAPAGIVDASRFAHHWQSPASHFALVVKACRKLFQERADMVGRVRHAEQDRMARQLWVQLLSCASQVIVRLACDNACRVQTSVAANRLRSLVSIIPPNITPFCRPGDRKLQLIDKDKQIGNIFSIPSALDTIQLRSLHGSEEVDKIMKTLFDGNAPPFEEMDTNKRATSSRINVFDRENIFNGVVEGAEMDFGGAVSVALVLLHEMACLMGLRFALANIDGDAITLLRLRRMVRYRQAAVDAGADCIGSFLSKTDPTYENVEELCSELARVAYRLNALGEGARNPRKVIGILRTEVRAALRQFAVVLRKGKREFLRIDANREGQLLHQWTNSFEDDWVRFGTNSQTPEVICSPTKGECSTSDDADVPSFLCALLGRYASCVDPESIGVDDMDSGIVRPFHAFPRWQCPKLPFDGLSFLVCNLPLERRVQLSKIRAKLTERRIAYNDLLSHPVHSESGAHADIFLFGSLLHYEIFREVCLCGHLRTPPPLTKASQMRFEEHFEVLYPSEDSTVHRWRIGDDPMEEITAHDAEAEMQCVWGYLNRFAVSMYQMLKTTFLERLRQETVAATDLLMSIKASQSSTLRPSAGETSGPRFQSFRGSPDHRPNPAGAQNLSTNGSEQFAIKMDAILRPLNALKASASYVRMDPKGSRGERAFLLREWNINSCLHELMASLPHWELTGFRSRSQRTRELLDYIRSRNNALLQEMSILEGCSVARGRSVAADFPREGLDSAAQVRDVTNMKGEVADRAMRLTVEVDRLHRILREVQSASRELEHRLKNEAWEKVRAPASKLFSTLSAEKGCFSENQLNRFSILSKNMRQIREHVAIEFSGLAAKNFGTQERAKQSRQEAGVTQQANEDPGADDEADHDRTEAPPVVSDGMHGQILSVAGHDDINELAKTIQKLKDRQTCARIFNMFKCQALCQRHEQLMETLTMTLESNRELSQRLAEAAQQHRQAVCELTNEAKYMSVAEKKIEDLSLEAETNSEERQRLQTWKRNKVIQMRHIEQTLKEQRLNRGANADHMAETIKEKSEKVHQMQEECDETTERLEEAFDESEAKTQQVRNEMLDLRRVKETAHEEVKMLRQSVCGGPMSAERRLLLWRARASHEMSRVRELEAENRKLKILAQRR